MSRGLLLIIGESSGGWGGIRTHGRLHVAGFQDRCLKPLGHPSAFKTALLGIQPRLDGRRTLKPLGHLSVGPAVIRASALPA